MNRKLILSLPLALLAACSQTPVPAAPAAQKTVAQQLDAHRLQGQHWLLKDATTVDGKRIDALFVRADKPVTLDFSDDQLSVSNTCNRMSGGYTLAAGTLTLSQMVSTKMACEPSVMALDDAVGSRLQGAVDAGLADDGALTLRTARGDVLVFQAEPTAETRFGGEGETMFLEVAAQTRPCPHPLIKDKQCLQVREVRFNEQGLKQGEPGAFENFYDGIEGYAHQAGTRNVLRVKRFRIANPPADASSQAYVLDMVVESASGK